LLSAGMDAIRPVKCDPSKLGDEIKKLNATMKDLDSEKWENRDKAMKRIAGIVLQHESSDDEFARQIHSIRMTLQTQVEDLRSTIVRTAAVLCVLLNEELGAAFIQTFEFLIPSFIKQLAVKAVPTRESSHQCLMRIVVASESDRILKVLMSYNADKNKVIRTRIAMYVAQVAEHWEKDTLQRSLRDILKYLHIAQGDGESLVRKSAREAVSSLGTNFPAGIAQFVLTVEDPKQRKELEKVVPEPVLEFIKANPGKTLAAPTSQGAGRLSLNTKPVRNSYSGVRPEGKKLSLTPAATTTKSMSISAGSGRPRTSMTSRATTARSTGLPRVAESSGIGQPTRTGRSPLSTSNRSPRNASPRADHGSSLRATSRVSMTARSGRNINTSPRTVRRYAAPTAAAPLSAEEKRKRAMALAGSTDLLGDGDAPNSARTGGASSARGRAAPSPRRTPAPTQSVAREDPQPVATPTSTAAGGGEATLGQGDILARLQMLKTQVQTYYNNAE